MKISWRIAILFVLALFLAGCGLQNQATSPIQDNDSNPGSMLYENNACPPEWVYWLATHWDGDIDEWIALGDSLEMWLRNSPEYGDGVKTWDMATAVADANIYCNSSKDERDISVVCQTLFDELVANLSTEDTQRSFCLDGIKEPSLQVIWSNERNAWVCTMSADIHYKGMLLPYGPTPDDTYYTVCLGLFEVVEKAGIWRLTRLPFDTPI